MSTLLGEQRMDIVLTAVFGAIFFYVLYGVIRAGTRDGIIAARKLAEQDTAAADSGPRPE